MESQKKLWKSLGWQGYVENTCKKIMVKIFHVSWKIYIHGSKKFSKLKQYIEKENTQIHIIIKMLQTNDKVLKVTRRKEIIKIRAEIYKRTIEKINKAKSQFFENVNEIKA